MANASTIYDVIVKIRTMTSGERAVKRISDYFQSASKSMIALNANANMAQPALRAQAVSARRTAQALKDAARASKQIKTPRGVYYAGRARPVMDPREAALKESARGSYRGGSGRRGGIMGGGLLHAYAHTMVAGHMLGGATSALVGYNAEMESARLGTATLINMFQKTGQPRALQLAADLTEKLRVDAENLPGSFQELQQMFKGIAVTGLQSGLGLDDIREISSNAVVASKAFGIQADVFMRDIQQMMQGRLTVRDMGARTLLGQIGMGHEDFNKIARSDPQKAAKMIKQLLGTGAIKEAADAYEKSFSGTVERLKSKFQKIFGDIGMPLFDAIKEDMDRLEKWMADNPEKLKKIINDVGQMLVSVYEAIKTLANAVKELVAFIFNHKDFFLTLAKSFLVIKAAAGVNALGGMLGGLAGKGAAGGITGMAASLSGIQGGIGGIFSTLSRGIMILGLTKMASEGIAAAINRKQDEKIAGIEKGASTGRDVAMMLGSMVGESGVMSLMRLRHGRLTGSLGTSRSFGEISSSFAVTEQTKKEAEAAGLALTPYLQRQAQSELDRNQLIRGYDQYGQRMLDVEALKRQFGVSSLFYEGKNGTLAEDTLIQNLKRKFDATDTNEKAMLEYLEGIRDATAGMVEHTGESVQQLDERLRKEREEMAKAQEAAKNERAGKDPSGKTKPGIEKMVINVASDDPDRFAMGIEGIFNDWVKSPSQGSRTLRNK